MKKNTKPASEKKSLKKPQPKTLRVKTAVKAGALTATNANANVSRTADKKAAPKSGKKTAPKTLRVKTAVKAGALTATNANANVVRI